MLLNFALLAPATISRSRANRAHLARPATRVSGMCP